MPMYEISMGCLAMSLERAYKLGMISNNPAKTVGNVKKVKSGGRFLDERGVWKDTFNYWS